jgi:hypothetical protein
VRKPDSRTSANKLALYVESSKKIRPYYTVCYSKFLEKEETWHIFKDLRKYIEALDNNGKLVRIKKETLDNPIWID